MYGMRAKGILKDTGEVTQINNNSIIESIIAIEEIIEEWTYTLAYTRVEF